MTSQASGWKPKPPTDWLAVYKYLSEVKGISEDAFRNSPAWERVNLQREAEAAIAASPTYEETRLQGT